MLTYAKLLEAIKKAQEWDAELEAIIKKRESLSEDSYEHARLKWDMSGLITLLNQEIE